jgi:hypothetical protein
MSYAAKIGFTQDALAPKPGLQGERCSELWWSVD